MFLWQEAAKFSEVQGFKLTDIKEIALKTAALPKKNSKRSRIVVFTQGADNVILAKGESATPRPDRQCHYRNPLITVRITVVD